ncbi:hypothetical protein V7S43_011928 [Phytophthora oleae]|uniref:Protein kinase domain-containing protein n=1 Tax=Phytophthora oleae TaxID=2107226 RepID=A0ABD3F7Z4_9STRA
MLFGKRVLRPPRPGQTEKSYHVTWDMVFHNVLDLIFTRSRCYRESCTASSTTKRPDFYCVLDGVCVFRGEEEAPDVSIRVATKDLCSRLVWRFGRVPYMLGYAASGYNIDLLARHLDDNEVVTKTVIKSYDFERKEHMFKAKLAMLNLSLLFPAIVEACPEGGKDEYRDITRSSGVVVRLFPTFIKKVFPDTSGFDHLRLVYGQMERAGAPNVDHLTALRFQKKSLVFEPRGTDKKPSTLLDLFTALRDVLEALVALHRLGWIHRDIRWSNVTRQRNDGFLVLIDFADAATSPQPSSTGQHLSVEEHAPEIFVENGKHTTAVDIWAVGFLIESCGLERGKWQDSAERSSFCEWLMAKDPTARPSAEGALAELVALEKIAKREQEATREMQQEGGSRQSETQSLKRKRAT